MKYFISYVFINTPKSYGYGNMVVETKYVISDEIQLTALKDYIIKEVGEDQLVILNFIKMED